MSEQSRRPVQVVERDRSVAAKLLEGPQSLRAVAEALGLDAPAAYRSVWRLRKEGLVDKSRDGSRTPTWALTEAGNVFATTPPPEVAPPTPEPVPLPEEPPVF